ncbi:MAG: RDD family protein [Phycisphaerales bacterium]
MSAVGSTRWHWLGVLFAVLLPCVAAEAQIATGARPYEPGGDSHAWAVTPSTVSNDWGLWHIPPRSGATPAEDGAVRIVDSLERQPAAIAAYGGRVWMAFAGGGNRAGYAFLTAAVRPGAIDGTWYTGAGGRLASTAFLETTGRVIALAAGERGPIALIEDPDGPISIAWLERNVWERANGPSPIDSVNPQSLGVLQDGSIVLATIDSDQVRTWIASLPDQPQESSTFELLDPDALLKPFEPAEDEIKEAVEIAWVGSSASLQIPVADGRVDGAVGGIGSRLVLGVETTDALRVIEVDGDLATTLYETAPGGLALLAEARRGIAVRLGDEAEGAQGRAATRLVIEEFSLDTGRLFFVGPAVFDGPISPSDLRILLVLMVLVSASLLLFVVRTSSEAKPFVAPPGCVLAPPIPRLLAGLADGFLALLLGGELSRVLPPGWLAVRIGADALDFAPLVLGLAIGLVGSALLEAATGRTRGKLVFGLAASRSGELDGRPIGPRRPGLGPSLARNAVKWLLPLVAIAGLMSPLMRHRGDSMAGLGVIGEAAEPASESSSGPDSSQDRGPDDR